MGGRDFTGRKATMSIFSRRGTAGASRHRLLGKALAENPHSLPLPHNSRAPEDPGTPPPSHPLVTPAKTEAGKQAAHCPSDRCS